MYKFPVVVLREKHILIDGLKEQLPPLLNIETFEVLFICKRNRLIWVGRYLRYFENKIVFINRKDPLKAVKTFKGK